MNVRIILNGFEPTNKYENHPHIVISMDSIPRIGESIILSDKILDGLENQMGKHIREIYVDADGDKQQTYNLVRLNHLLSEADTLNSWGVKSILYEESADGIFYPWVLIGQDDNDVKIIESRVYEEVYGKEETNKV